MASCYLCKGQQRIQEHPAKTTHIYTDSLWINFHLTSPHSTFILIPPSILPSAFFLTFFLSSSLSFSLFLSLSLVKCLSCLPSSSWSVWRKTKTQFLIWYQFVSSFVIALCVRVWVCVAFSFYSHDTIWATHTHKYKHTFPPPESQLTEIVVPAFWPTSFTSCCPCLHQCLCLSLSLSPLCFTSEIISLIMFLDSWLFYHDSIHQVLKLFSCTGTF